MIKLIYNKFGEIAEKFSGTLKSEFAKNVSTLMSGSVISQIIPFLVSPIVARLYFPKDYAIVAAYNSITVLLTIVATGMYSSALMIDKRDEEAFNTGTAAFIVTCTITLISLIVFIIFTDSIAMLTGNENITFWLYLIPSTVFFTGGYQTLNMWNNRKKRYRRLAGNRIFQTIITSGTTLIFGFLSYHGTGLMISLLLGQIFAFSLLFIQTYKNDKNYLSSVSYNSVISSFKRHKDFPKYNMPQGFLDGFRESSIVLIISNYFGPVVLGSYTFAMGLLNKPLNLIGEAYRQVYFQKASSLYNTDKGFGSFTKKNILILSSLVLPFFLLIFIWGEEIFRVIFGNNWSQAGLIAQILCLWLFFRFLLSPLSSIPLILMQQKRFFMFGLINNLSLPIILFIGAYLKSDKNLVFVLFSFTGIINVFAQMLWFNKIVRNYERKNQY